MTALEKTEVLEGHLFLRHQGLDQSVTKKVYKDNPSQ